MYQNRRFGYVQVRSRGGYTVRPYAGRIYASEHYPQIYMIKSIGIEKKLPSDLIKQNMQNQYTLLASASRSANMDWFIRSFLERRPDGVIVQLGCGLETTYHRCG